MGATGRFGPRLGKSTRIKIGRAEESVKNSKKSPFCNKDTVVRLSSGIWYCKKTGKKFTGKAYSFDAKSMTKRKTSDQVALEVKLEE